MERKPHNDIRADHEVTVFPYATNVKFFHNGYEISLAGDGQETFVFNGDGQVVFEYPGTGADAVSAAYQWIISQD